MTTENEGLPARPFFNCTPEGLTILDAANASSLLRADSVEPWMVFTKGQGNMIDSTPRKLASRSGARIAVECEGGTVHIDFDAGSARKVTADGEFVYMGSVEERNDGMGYIAVS